MDRCPNCGRALVFAGRISQYNSEFYKCLDGCHHIFERIFDNMFQKFEYIDIFLMYKDIKNKRIAE
jgi:hypothetical protein